MKKKLDVTVLFDDDAYCPNDPDFEKTDTEDSVEHDVIQALRRLGHRLTLVRVGGSVAPLVRRLTENPPDVVFNLTEQFRGERRMDYAVAGLLELLDIPFTGTGSMGLMLCRNKAWCKQILAAAGNVAVPRHCVIAPGAAIRLSRDMDFPLVVKPLLEDGSDGISNASVVRNAGELRERCRMIHQRFCQAAIAEQYIDGREIYISIIGTDRLTVLPPRELFLPATARGGPRIATEHVKWNKDYRQRWGVVFDFAQVDEALERELERTCKRTFRMLQIIDYGRIDARVTADNTVVVIEANPNPNLSRVDELAQSAEKAGIGYDALIERIMRMALRRRRIS